MAEKKYVKEGRVPSARGADKKMGHYIEQPGLLLPGDLQITLWDIIYTFWAGEILWWSSCKKYC